jgi:hypothetical protein
LTDVDEHERGWVTEDVRIIIMCVDNALSFFRLFPPHTAIIILEKNRFIMIFLNRSKICLQSMPSFFSTVTCRWSIFGWSCVLTILLFWLPRVALEVTIEVNFFNYSRNYCPIFGETFWNLNLKIIFAFHQAFLQHT